MLIRLLSLTLIIVIPFTTFSQVDLNNGLMAYQVSHVDFVNTSDLFFGRLNDLTFSYWFNGDLDVVHIYNGALNADRIEVYSGIYPVTAPCESWAKITSSLSAIRIGDLDVSGNQITVEASFNRTAPYFGSELYAGDLVSKHMDPSNVNYLLRPNSAEITTTNGYYRTPDICDINLNKTYHVAMVYNGSTLKFYRNGFLMSSVACSGNLYQNDYITTIGSLASDLNNTSENLVGYINEVRIWNVARTQSEIRQYMNQPLPNPATQDGLLAYYNFGNLKNQQGNAEWDATLVGNAMINQTNPECNFSADSCKECALKISAGKDVSICYNTSTQLNATGAISYNWNASNALSDTTIATPVAKPLTTTNFIVTGYDSTKTCSDKDTVKVTVLPLPVFTLTNNTTICRSTVVQLNASSKSNYHYHWIPPDNLSDTSIANPTSTPSDSVKYFVTAADSNNCRSLDSVQINVVPRPTVSTINDTSICLHDTIILSTNTKAANTFSWSPFSALSIVSVPDPAAFPDTTTNYIVSVGNGICYVKDSVLITVLSLPNIFAGNDTTTCGNSVAQLQASGAAAYQWQPVAGLSDKSISNPVASPVVTTIYYVTGTGLNGCKKNDSVTINKVPDPVFTISVSDSTICSKQSISLSASGGDIYTWLPAQSVSNPTSSKTLAYPALTTNFLVSIYNDLCKVSKTLGTTVTVKASPDVLLSKSNDIDCSNLQAQLNAAGGATYNWLPDTFINNTQIANPIVNPQKNTWYSVRVTGKDSCVTNDSILVKSVIGNIGFYVPSAFTPNGDGLNDCFELHYWGNPASFDMIIYDKWGYPVFHSNDIGKCWNGTVNGKKQGAGTYVYMITANSVCGQQKVFRKGTVVLIR